MTRVQRLNLQCGDQVVRNGHQPIFKGDALAMLGSIRTVIDHRYDPDTGSFTVQTAVLEEILCTLECWNLVNNRQQPSRLDLVDEE